jgi:hypothetical protein
MDSTTRHVLVPFAATLLLAPLAVGAIEDSVAVSPYATIRGVDVEAVKWTKGFWAEKFDLCRRAMLPSVEAALLDKRNAEQLVNFRVAAGLEQGPYRGTDWSDGDCYKWIEAMAYMYAVTRDPDLDRKMDHWIGIIAKAQVPDGYLSTNIQLNPKKKRWEDVHHHALYNMGHLITAACAHKRATGKDSFLNVARKAADYLHSVFASRPPALARMDFNPSQMMALVDLYRVTGERRYLELADVFITMRGSAPATMEEIEKPRHIGGTDLTQDRVPLREEDQAVGHAVTGTYLWCGAADLYMETGEHALWTALERIWRSAGLRRTYITGGACALPGGTSTRGDSVHEAFGGDFQLPNRTAYNETCANIGNAMWNWRMLQISGDARYADVLETVLYNSALSAVSASGHDFFYANPLEWNGRSGWPTEHFTQTRWFVHSCYCCPPQVARTIAGLGHWAYGVSAEGMWIHLYGGSTLKTRLPDSSPVGLTQQTDYPWDGHVKITLTQVPPRPCALKLRIPGWAERAKLKLNGKAVAVAGNPGTYATVRRQWSRGDVVELDMPMEVRLMEANPAVEACRNRVAVMRGPVLYCLEAMKAQDGERLWNHGVFLPENVTLAPRHDKTFLGGVTVLDGKALTGKGHTDFTQQNSRVPPAKCPDWGDALYRKFAPRQLPPPPSDTLDITLIPYFAWANRGPSLMEVWIPLAK